MCAKLFTSVAMVVLFALGALASDKPSPSTSDASIYYTRLISCANSSGRTLQLYVSYSDSKPGSSFLADTMVAYVGKFSQNRDQSVIQFVSGDGQVVASFTIDSDNGTVSAKVVATNTKPATFDKCEMLISGGSVSVHN